MCKMTMKKKREGLAWILNMPSLSVTDKFIDSNFILKEHERAIHVYQKDSNDYIGTIQS